LPRNEHPGPRCALREAPDVILLGELRDRDTIAAALTAAEPGLPDEESDS
jgi:twitching motility protein PilT